MPWSFLLRQRFAPLRAILPFPRRALLCALTRMLVCVELSSTTPKANAQTIQEVGPAFGEPHGIVVDGSGSAFVDGVEADAALHIDGAYMLENRAKPLAPHLPQSVSLVVNDGVPSAVSIALPFCV